MTFDEIDRQAQLMAHSEPACEGVNYIPAHAIDNALDADRNLDVGNLAVERAAHQGRRLIQSAGY